MPQEEWIKWRTCTRKVKHTEKPEATANMRVYRCLYCDGWHRTKRKKRLITKAAPRTDARTVLRGGYRVEK